MLYGTECEHALMNDNEILGEGVPVTPLVKGPAIPILARILIGSVLVGVIAFVAAVQLGGRQSADSGVALATTPPAPQGSAARSSVPQPSPVTAVASRFAIDFQPQALIAALDSGGACASSAASSPVPAGPTLTRAWVTSCPLAASNRAAIQDGLMSALAAGIPNSVSGLTRDYKISGMTLLYYLYSDGPFKGTLVMTFATAGNGLVIASTLQEAQVRP